MSVRRFGVAAAVASMLSLVLNVSRCTLPRSTGTATTAPPHGCCPEGPGIAPLVPACCDTREAAAPILVDGGWATPDTVSRVAAVRTDSDLGVTSLAHTARTSLVLRI